MDTIQEVNQNTVQAILAAQAQAIRLVCPGAPRKPRPVARFNMPIQEQEEGMEVDEEEGVAIVTIPNGRVIRRLDFQEPL